MMAVQDEQTSRIYTEGLDSAALKKAVFVAQFLPVSPDRRLIVDFGCMTGTVAALLKRAYPQDDVEGLDINPTYIREAEIRYGAEGVSFSLIDPGRGLPYVENSASAFAAQAVLHEIYTYNGFQHQPVVDTLNEMHRALEPGGRVIIRDPAKPDDPDEQLHITLNNTAGRNPHSLGELLQAPPSELSQAVLMRRFIHQYIPLQRNPSAQERVSQLNENQYIMPAWLISEFFRKRTFVYTPEYWDAEMKEQNAAFNADELRKLAIDAGFKQKNVFIVNGFEKDFYGKVTDIGTYGAKFLMDRALAMGYVESSSEKKIREYATHIKESEDIAIRDMNGRWVDQDERLPSHLYGLLVKE